MNTDEVGTSREVERDGQERLSAMLLAERERGFPSLAGTHAEIAVPLRQVLIDRLVAQALARTDGTDVAVEILEGARLAISVSRRVFGLPARARTVLTIDPIVDARQRRLVLRHDDSLLWRTIRGLVAPLGFLPSGISFADGTVLVDLETLAARGGWGDLLGFVTRLEIHGPADGLILIDADLVVHAPEAGRPPAVVATRSTGSGSPILRPDEVLEGIAGARARAEIHVTEAIVNEVLGVGRTMLDEPTPRTTSPPDVRWWTSWIRELTVRFERGELVVVADVEVPGSQAHGSGEPDDRSSV